MEQGGPAQWRRGQGVVPAARVGVRRRWRSLGFFRRWGKHLQHARVGRKSEPTGALRAGGNNRTVRQAVVGQGAAEAATRTGYVHKILLKKPPEALATGRAIRQKVSGHSSRSPRRWQEPDGLTSRRAARTVLLHKGSNWVPVTRTASTAWPPRPGAVVGLEHSARAMLRASGASGSPP